MSLARVLDPCCGSRMMWFDRSHPDVVFGDRRSERLTVTDRSNGRENGTRSEDLRQGFAECFRVLDVDGTLVFKWNEAQVKIGEVLPLAPHAPLFGHLSGRKGLTHWLVFMKPRQINGAA